MCITTLFSGQVYLPAPKVYVVVGGRELVLIAALLGYE